MKTWQEMVDGEIRRLMAVSDSLLTCGASGGPSAATMQARDHVCAAVVVLNKAVRDDEKARSEAAKPTPEEKKTAKKVAASKA